MLTTSSAARLLASIRSRDDLPRLTRELGFAPPLPLGRGARDRFGIGADVSGVRVAAAGNSLRALLVEWITDGPDASERVGALGRAVARGAPGMRWLVVARDARTGEVVLAAPSPDGRSASALRVEPAQVRASDADTLAALAACAPGPDSLVHLRWRETLGRDALTHRFYRDLERAVSTLAATADGRVPGADRRTIAILHVSRLLFLAFLEAKGWLDADRSFLRCRFEACCGGRGAHRRLLEPLFFGTLNTPVARRAPAARALGRVPFLNGGLFGRTPLESRHRDLRFTDDAIGEVLGGLLSRYRLTARETRAEWSDAAVDPEMLGRAFESLMAAAERRARGAFYTPHAIIARLTRAALDEQVGPEDDPHPGALDRVRLIDPACGSGAFLVFALEELAARRAAAGDRSDLAARRRHVLTRSIFGVDVDPTAVWLCQLRLWLSVVVEDPTEDPARLVPLPNLDRNVREGDALAGHAFGDARADARVDGDRALGPLRLRYARASGVRKRTLGRALDRAERARALAAESQRIVRIAAERRELLLAVRSRDLFRARPAPDAATRALLDRLRAAAAAARARLRRLRDGGALPFSFATHFADAAREGGFALVIGNPPWVRTRDVPSAMREALRERFFTVRSAAWQDGAAAAAAGRGFASQADLAAVFVERAVQLAAPGALIALLVPSKLWSALAGGGVRQLLMRHAPPLQVEDWQGASAGFDAVVYPSALIARRVADSGDGSDPADPSVRLTLHRDDSAREWSIPRAALALDGSAGAPWLQLPPDVRAGFDRLVAAGIPLATSPFGRPILGVKSGCNEAFVVEPVPNDDPDDPVTVRSGSIEGVVEALSLRPVLRGEHLRAWSAHGRSMESIVWTHDRRGDPAAVLPPGTKRWLTHWRRRLETRADGRGDRWWALFRTEAARADRPRVVWADIGRAPRAAVLVAGDPSVPLNTCYVVRAPGEDDAHALAAILNSSVAGAWLGVLAEPARGGYRRYLGWTCARLPIPREWDRARELLAPIGRAGATGAPPDPATLAATVLDAYRVPSDAVAALLEWDAS